MAELIREKVLLLTRRGPHATAVVVDRWARRPESGRVWATIYVERPSQKG